MDAYREALRRPSNAVYARLHRDGVGDETLRGRDGRPPRASAASAARWPAAAAVRRAPARPRSVRARGRDPARWARTPVSWPQLLERLAPPRARRRPDRRRRAACVDARRCARLPDGAHRRERRPRRRSWTSRRSPREVRSGRLRCALDVTDPEPLPPRHPLRRCRGAVLTPHVGAARREVRAAIADIVLDDLERFFRGRPAAQPGDRGHAGADDMKLSFSTLGCPSWSLARDPRRRGPARLRRRRAAVRRGRRRAVGAARAHAAPACAETLARLRDAGARGLLRRHALVLPPPARRRARARPRRGARGRWSWRRGWARRASASSATACSRGRTSTTTRALVAEALARLGEIARAARRRGVARVARRLRARAATRSRILDRVGARRRSASSGTPPTRSSRRDARRRARARSAARAPRPPQGRRRAGGRREGRPGSRAAGPGRLPGPSGCCPC